MSHKAYIFDFDGTLVQSNAIKKEAFYHLSPEIADNRTAVDTVLSAIPEKSRYEIVQKIYEVIHSRTGVQYPQENVTTAIHRYSSTVRSGVLSCPEVEGATMLLEHLKKSGKLVYVSSNTPEESLGELIEGRGWASNIDGYFGFPKLKPETVRYIQAVKSLSASDIIVIGDGLSDEIAASETGCSFYKVTNDKSLLEFYASLNSSNQYV